MAQCGFIKSDGQPCGAHKIRTGRFCFRHGTDKASQVIASQRGGLNRRLQAVYGQEVILQSPADIRNFLGQIINGIYTGKLPLQLGTGLAYLSRTWLDAHQASEVDQRLTEIEKRLDEKGV